MPRIESTRQEICKYQYNNNMTKQDITVLAKENGFDLIGKEWMLVTAGTPD